MEIEHMAGKSADYGDVSGRDANLSISKFDENFAGRSADFGEASNMDNYNMSKIDEKMNGDKNSADFGDISTNNYNASKIESYRKTTEALEDQEGHSDESSEGVVANHDPFNGIQDAIVKQSKKP